MRHVEWRRSNADVADIADELSALMAFRVAQPAKTVRLEVWSFLAAQSSFDDADRLLELITARFAVPP